MAKGRVQDRVAIVTGAANGMGAATSRLLAQEGAKVILADIDEENGERVAASIQASGGEAIFTRLDVTKEEDWIAIMALAEKRYGGLHILINNAGILPAGSSIMDLSQAQFRKTLAINVEGPFLGCKHGVKLMKQGTAKGGFDCAIVNISSALGMVGAAKVTDYCASKGAVRLLTKSVALECAEDRLRIRVNSVHPGATDTQMIRYLPVDGSGSGSGSNELYDMMRKTHPLGRIADPKDIGYAVLFLASDEAINITGAELSVDGGLVAQ
jgi:3(or 17)beta-hydroxysteroid dehydrogenase